MYFDRKMFIELRGTSRAGILGQEELEKSVRARLCTLSISPNYVERKKQHFLTTQKRMREAASLHFVNSDAHFLPPTTVDFPGSDLICRGKTRFPEHARVQYAPFKMRPFGVKCISSLSV